MKRRNPGTKKIALETPEKRHQYMCYIIYWPKLPEGGVVFVFKA